MFCPSWLEHWKHRLLPWGFGREVPESDVETTRLHVSHREWGWSSIYCQQVKMAHPGWLSWTPTLDFPFRRNREAEESQRKKVKRSSGRWPHFPVRTLLTCSCDESQGTDSWKSPKREAEGGGDKVSNRRTQSWLWEFSFCIKAILRGCLANANLLGIHNIDVLSRLFFIWGLKFFS